MDLNRFDALTRSLSAVPYRRTVLRSLGVAGFNLLSALGAGEASTRSEGDSSAHRDTRQNRTRTRDRPRSPRDRAEREPATGERGGNLGEAAPEAIRDETRQERAVHGERKRKGGPRQDPTGPTGPTGPAGPVGATLPTRRVSSGFSNPLPVTAGATVRVTADCEGIGKVVSCGYLVSAASSAQLVNVLVNSVEPGDDRSGCVVQLCRAAEAGPPREQKSSPKPSAWPDNDSEAPGRGVGGDGWRARHPCPWSALAAAFPGGRALRVRGRNRTGAARRVRRWKYTGRLHSSDDAGPGRRRHAGTRPS